MKEEINPQKSAIGDLPGRTPMSGTIFVLVLLQFFVVQFFQCADLQFVIKFLLNSGKRKPTLE